MTKIIITEAGLDELVSADQSGTDLVTITEAGFGTGKYTASRAMTALSAEFKRINTIAGGAVGNNVIHLTITDSSDDAYSVYEVGLYTQKGTLFAVYSQNTPILQKASGTSAILAVDIVFTEGSPENITVGDLTFTLPPATTELQGIVELATSDEAVAGIDEYRAVTPKALSAVTATTERRGLVELATLAEAANKTEASKAITPSVMAAAVLDLIYPVGSIYMSTKNVSPASFIGGTWSALNEGRVLIGANSTYSAGSKGSEATHKLSTNELPAHSHSGSTGGAGGHNHTRGDMEIYGESTAAYGVNHVGTNGALFADFGTGGRQDGGNGADGEVIQTSKIKFQASRNWTGSTSSQSNHTHSVTINNTGGNVAHNNMQPYLAVYMWSRTA